MPAGQIKLKTPPSAISKPHAAQASKTSPYGDTSRARKAEKLKDRYRASLKEPARCAGVPNFAGRRSLLPAAQIQPKIHRLPFQSDAPRRRPKRQSGENIVPRMRQQKSKKLSLAVRRTRVASWLPVMAGRHALYLSPHVDRISRFTSAGLSPKYLLNSRLNCDGLSYPTSLAA